jgi:hypothetical protein
MKRIFSSTFAAVAVGLCLRLFLVLKFPSSSGDTVLYEQIAANWLKHGAYAMDIGGVVTPVDIRMPGYPAFLAILYAITGRTGESARLPVMLVQIAVDLLSCFLIATLAGFLALLFWRGAQWRRIFVVTLWLSALCPFTANYTAVPLTEVLAVFFTAASLLAFVAQLWSSSGGVASLFQTEWPTRYSESIFAVLGGVLVGLGTLFRPETPILLAASWLILAFVWLKQRRFWFWLQLVALSAAGCLLPLLPWAIRNAVTLHEVQFLAPRDSSLPGELVPRGS